MAAQLTDLLMPQSQGDFLREAVALVASADIDRLGAWWVRQNQHEWPDDGDDPIPVTFHPEWNGTQCNWAQKQMFRLLSDRLGERLEKLYWRAAGNATESQARAARAELEHERELRTISEPDNAEVTTQR